MPDEVVAATTTTEATPVTQSVMGNSDQPVISKDESVLDVAGNEAKAAQEAELKRLIEADPSTLTAEDVAKRDSLVKAQDEVKAKAIADEKAKGVPEKYEFKLPDGMTIDEARYGKVAPVFKDLGLTNDQAQKLIDLDLAIKKEEADKSAVAFKQFLETSAKETMEHLGANAKSELAYVAKVKSHLSAETIEVLNASGMGNVKSFIVDMAKLGRLLSEEKLVDTGKGSVIGKDASGILYPNMVKQ